MRILVTGGAGYIGAHTCVELLGAGHEVVILDNFHNSHPAAVERIGKIAGKVPALVKADVRDREAVEKALREHACGSVIHFAGWKAVGESAAKPLEYYDNNVVGTLRLLEAMKATGCKTIVFSSSATVYGVPQKLPYTEDHPLAPYNPYGRTKRFVEDMLRDLKAAEADWRIALLRYFNPVGAHESGLIGEDPNGIPNNLMPYIAQVAVGRRAELPVFGNDYPTPDGTGVRDYIHVMDLAGGHVAALNHIQGKPDLLTVNLGTGKGVSVLEMVKAFEKASGKQIPVRMMPRRAGDLAAYWADTGLASSLLGWVAKRSLEEICADTWRWQSQNPDGYQG